MPYATKALALCLALVALIGCGKSKAALKKDLQSEDAEVRFAAADQLSKTAPDDHDAIPVLVEFFTNPSVVKHAASESLARYDESAIPVLVKLLPKRGAAQTLGAMGERGKAAVPALVAVIQDPKLNGVAKMHSARALGQIGPSAREAVPALTAELKSQNLRKAGVDGGNYRLELAVALYRIDPKDALALETLNACKTDPNPHVSKRAAEVLGGN